MRKIILGIIASCSFSVLLTGCATTNAKYYYESAVLEFEAENYDEALENISSAIEQSPDKKEYYVCSGMINIGLGNYEKALEDFGKGFSDGTEDIDNENNKSAYRGRGIVYLYLGKYTEAITDFDKALSYECLSEMDTDIKEFKIEALIRSEDYNQASVLCDEVIKSEGEKSELLILKGACESKLSQYDSAKTYFDKALKEGNNLAYYYLSIMYKEQGKLEEAVSAIKEYMNKDKNADKGAVYCDIASSYIEANEFQKAIDTITEGYNYADDDTKKILMRNEIAAIEGKLDFSAAYSKAQEYIALYPDDEVVLKEIEFLKTRIPATQ